MKAFLAGKRGICPDCDAKFIVPKLSDGVAVPVDPLPVAPSETPPPIAPSLPESWYVRSVSGEQYGPANTELIQSWVAEGRVAEDSLVWQTGWDDWKIAREVFELLKPTPAIEPAPQIDSLEIDPRAVEETLPEETLTSKPRKPRFNSRKERARKISVALGVLVLVLAAVLVLVL